MDTTTPIFCHALVTCYYTDNHGNLICGSDGLPKEFKTRATFAALPAAPGEKTSWAASWVAPNDNFVRAIGRGRAEARLLRRKNLAHSCVVFSDQYVDFWQAIFADALQYTPCRWTVTDISFFTKPEVTAEVE